MSRPAGGDIYSGNVNDLALRMLWQGGAGQQTSGWEYNGKTYASKAEAEAARQADLAAAQAASGQGRLAQWAQEGTKPVDWQGPSAAELAAVTDPAAIRGRATDYFSPGGGLQGPARPQPQQRRHLARPRPARHRVCRTSAPTSSTRPTCATVTSRPRDLATLATIFFGGKGQTSDMTQQSSGSSSGGGGFNFGLNLFGNDRTHHLACRSAPKSRRRRTPFSSSSPTSAAPIPACPRCAR